MTVSYFSFLNIIINIVESPNAWRLLEIAFLSLNHCFFWLSLTWLGSAQLCSAWRGSLLKSKLPSYSHTLFSLGP